MDEAIETLEALAAMNVPDAKDAGKRWVQSEAFDKAVGKLSGMSYRSADRKADRQRMVPISAVISILAEMEDEMVKSAVRGPWGSLLHMTKGPVRAAKRAAEFAETLAEAELDQLRAEARAAEATWQATKGTIMERIGRVAGPFADQAKRMIDRVTDAVFDPRAIASAFMLAVAGVMTLPAIRRQLTGAVAAKDAAVDRMRARAFPQRRVARVAVRKRTRN